MPAAQRDVIKPPNEGQFKTNSANNGSVPMTRSASPEHPPNLSRFMHGDAGSTADMARQASPIDPPNASKFRDGDKGMSLDNPTPTATEPGKGAVPVNPWMAPGGETTLRQPPSTTLRSK